MPRPRESDSGRSPQCSCQNTSVDRSILFWSRRQESNLYLPLRRRPFYPLNYGEVPGGEVPAASDSTNGLVTKDEAPTGCSLPCLEQCECTCERRRQDRHAQRLLAELDVMHA